ncbi:MAG TPA: phosphate ABC transporter permease subunit PstC [Thermoleophilaceae bacterium]|jgi:phosphate transport system permease protein
MAATTGSVAPAGGRARGRTRAQAPSKFGDYVLYGLCVLAALLAVATIVEIAYQVFHGARPAIDKSGLGFLGHTTWKPNDGIFGAGTFLLGTVVSSAMALALAAPIGISIGLYLSLLAPKGLRGIVSPLVELLAAIPSVILGFWGILILAPWLNKHAEPALHKVLGFLPIFGPVPTTGASIFTAGLILTIMVVPIVASISRDLFLTVPSELQDGALALGATRWETVRGVVLPSTASGVAAACCLGLGRALGEAIAVAQVIGAGNQIHKSLFETGDTLASRVALQFPGALSKEHFAALFYLAAILLVIGLVTNLLAQWIGRRFDVQRAVAR